MNFAKGSLGWIEVVCGPMFSGKSEELIRRLRAPKSRASGCRFSNPRSTSVTPATTSFRTAN